MKEFKEEIRKKILDKGLKITPQRTVILEAIHKLNNHPTADNIIEYIRDSNPNIAIGTVYKVLETFVENNIIRKVKTDNDVMRYDGITENHHHLYCSECDLIEDYKDEELDLILQEYFKKKNLTGFKIEGIVLQIRGTFDKC